MIADRSFKSIAELIQKAAEAEYETLLSEKLRSLEGEFLKRLEKLFEDSRKEMKSKANSLAVDLLHRADITGVEVRTRT